MRPHSRKFVDYVKDTPSSSSTTAAAPSFRSRDYYNHAVTTTSSNGKSDSSSVTAITNTGPPISTTDPSMALTVVVVLAALCFVGFFSVYVHCLSEGNYPDDPRRRRHQILRDRGSSSGIDTSIIESLPLFAYDGNVKEPVDCPICLTQFEEKEKVKVIPFCRHVFHPQCIDIWLSAHGSCPLCRSTQLLLPLPPLNDPSSCFVAIESVSFLGRSTDILGPTGIESEGQQRHRDVPMPPTIPSSSSSSAVTRVNSFSSSSREGDRVYSLPRSSSF